MVEKVRKLCKESNLSLTKLEIALGFGNGAIGRWDKSTPSIDKVIKVANYFGVSVDYLTGASDEKTPAATTGASEIKQKAIDEILAANDADVQMFMEMLRVVQKKNPAG